MSSILSAQLSVFGNFDVRPTPDKTVKIMSAINVATSEVFLPNIITSQQVEIPANRITSISNLGYVTQNQQYNIAILNERIDFNYRRIDESELDLQTFFLLAHKALSCIIEEESIVANRLAINIQYIAANIPSETMCKIGQSLISFPEAYTNMPLLEWSSRVNSQSNIVVLGKMEMLNTILDISTAVSVQTQEPALLYHLDINTFPQNNKPRFTSEALPDYISGVLPIANTISAQVERLISIE